MVCRTGPFRTVAEGAELVEVHWQDEEIFAEIERLGFLVNLLADSEQSQLRFSKTTGDFRLVDDLSNHDKFCVDHVSNLRWQVQEAEMCWCEAQGLR